MLFFRSMIRAMIIAYLSLCVAAHYGSLFYVEGEDDSINVPMALLVSAVIAASFFMAFFIESDELECPGNKLRFDEAYKGLKTEKAITMFTTCFFLIRRLLFVLALQCRIFSVQYGGIMFLVIINMCWLIEVRPHK